MECICAYTRGVYGPSLLFYSPSLSHLFISPLSLLPLFDLQCRTRTYTLSLFPIRRRLIQSPPQQTTSQLTVITSITHKTSQQFNSNFNIPLGSDDTLWHVLRIHSDGLISSDVHGNVLCRCLGSCVLNNHTC